MDDGDRRRALTRFASEGRRAQPPVFAGRKAVIEDISSAAELAYEKWSSGGIDAKDPGLTRLVQGAPGAGKTALLRHLQERWRGNPEPGRPITVRVSAGALESPEEMHKRLREQIPTTVMEKWGAVLVGGLIKTVPGGVADALEPVAEAATGVLREKAVASVPAAVVVMVDETQRVRPHSAAATTLQNLHEGAFGDIPVLPVFAGLGYLHSHLQQEGIKISRYSDDRRCVHTLGRLRDSECLALLREWLAHFGVVARPAESEQWGDALSRDTQGWPMHTSGFLAALADELAQSRNPAILASADLEIARKVAAEDRAVYYNGRYRGIIQANVRWVGRAMAVLGAKGDLLEEDATAIIRDVGPSDGDAPALFNALVNRGFLQRQGVGLTFACPIPSLISHAAVAASENLGMHTAAIVGDIETLRRLAAGGMDIESRDALGRTPLRVAAECRWAEVAQDLLKAGADADAPDSNGTTPRTAWREFEWPDPPRQAIDEGRRL